MRPRGPPRTSATTNAAQPWRAGPRASCGAQGRIHGRGGRPRPPAPPHAQGRCRWTMRPRGPPRTSAPTNAAQPWRAEPRTHHVARRTVYMVGADVLGRPPRARTGTTPVDDASTRAAEDVGPYQHRTSHDTQHRTSHDTQRRALTARAGPRISCGAQGRIHGRGGRPRPPAPRTHKDDAGGRCVRAGRRGRRPLPTPHSRGVQDRAHHVARRAVYMVGADVPGRPPPAQGRRRRTMRPRGPPWTSAPTNAAQPWCAGPRTHHVARRAI